ncbi:MATE family efflux transporter [Gaopeijia maritima]|uniref:Multidrug-efflux transporter n=1 Tax=Gaopeijia maritima TaxID=3119007 RepID=A0ABU9EFP1_9BACT
MNDLTEGPVSGHVVRMAVPIAIGMVFQTLYYLVDLYFVGRLGEAALAGLGTAGNLQFLVMALTQVLGVGTMALIAHASGRKDRDDANLIFNQSLGLAAVCAAFTLVGGYAAVGGYMRLLGADAATRAAGTTYLHWFLPGLGLQFALISMGAALRGTGIVRPTIAVQVFTVVLNAVLSPIMIAGWGTGRPLGVMGAGLSTSVSVAVGVALMALYFHRLERYVALDRSQLRPRAEVWSRILKVGLPPGGEFALLFVYMGVIYWAIRDFGAAAQAGFGIGNRVMQAFFLPAMAIAFATAPVAGQNMGAGLPDRVRATFRWSALTLSAVMVGLTLICRWRPELFIGAFTEDPEVIRMGSEFIAIVSLNFIASGIVFTCSGMFQALGNTVPSLAASASRLLTFGVPAAWLTTVPWFELHHLWYTSVLSVTLQAGVAWWLLSGEMRRRLPGLAPAGQP